MLILLNIIMNESRSKKALKTLKEMMIDRLYDVEEFKNKSDSILCKNEKNEFIFIKFITYNKIKPNIIKDLINTIYKNHLFDNLNNKLILIFNRKVNKSIYKLCDNKIYKNISGPDYIFKNDIFQRTNYKNILKKKNLNIN